MRVTEGRSDLDLAQHLVQRSKPTVMWMRDPGDPLDPHVQPPVLQGGRPPPLLGRAQLEAVGGGPGLVEALFERAAKVGIEVRYGVAGHKLIQDERGRVTGVVTRSAAGCERDPLPRGGHRLGRLRGQPGMAHALPRAQLGPRAGARHPPQRRRGHRDGARHRRAGLRPLVVLPRGGVGLERARLRRPARGRHVPEALVPARADRQRARASASWTRAPTSATTPTPSTGARSCASRRRPPSRSSTRRRWTAARGVPHPRDHQGGGGHHRGAGQEARGRTRRASPAPCGDFNAAVMDQVPFNPAVLDGRGTRGITPPKSNWAQRLDTPPYVGFGVTCGITFTFGGLRVDTRGQVLDTVGPAHPRPLRGGRAGGRALLPQLPGRHRPHVGRRLRQDRGRLRRRRPQIGVRS